MKINVASYVGQKTAQGALLPYLKTDFITYNLSNLFRKDENCKIVDVPLKRMFSAANYCFMSLRINIFLFLIFILLMTNKLW